jgi:8-oxo-dGTP pyrophosphatase MutT (NUDIX family)
MKVIYAGEEMPEAFTKSIFLAGPTPRNKKEVESWRPDALKLLEDMGYDGVVFVPEPKEVKENHVYEDQVEWEEEYLNVADCIVFWVPRDLTPDSTGFPKMAAFTTNVEWGAWVDSGKVVFGCPEDAEKVTYLKYYADKYNVPVGETLTETLDLALEKLGNGSERTGGERFVPLYIWDTDSFQNWYGSQKKAGNRLDRARLLYNFRPRFKDFVFLWVLKVEMWIESEQRSKTNEFVLARTDISTVLLWHKTLPQEFSEIVLIKEFRSPARTADGFIRELPGGSSPKKGTAPEETAAEEIHEETGFYLEPERIKFHEARQLAGTLSSHQSFFYSVELDEEEIEWFKSQKGIVHGKEEDTERTFIEVVTVKDLLKNTDVDWSTLGMVFAATYRARNEDIS